MQHGSVKAAVVSGVAMAATAVTWQCIRSRDGAAAKRGEAEAWMGEAAERLTIKEATRRPVVAADLPADGWCRLIHCGSPRGLVWNGGRSDPRKRE